MAGFHLTDEFLNPYMMAKRNAFKAALGMRTTKVFAAAGLDRRAIGSKSLIIFSCQGDGSHSAKQCIFNNK